MPVNATSGRLVPQHSGVFRERGEAQDTDSESLIAQILGYSLNLPAF